jgi:hypothetical protein
MNRLVGLRPRLCRLDPWGLDPRCALQGVLLTKGYDIRPTIAVTQAHLQIRLRSAMPSKQAGLKLTAKVVRENQDDVRVTKVAIEPVWYLPGMAKRLNVGEGDLRRVLVSGDGRDVPGVYHSSGFESPGFLRLGATTVYVFGDPQDLANPRGGA